METLKCFEVDYEVIDIENDVDVSDATQIRLKLPPILDNDFPTVSIVIPTYNRKDFHDLIFRNWDSIDYPREKMELLILDDSPGAIIPDFAKNHKQIRYIIHPKKLPIGHKRNLLCKYARNEYIVHMDDDDWYEKTSVACRIRILLEFQKKIKRDGCFGCTKVLCLDLISNQMFEAFDKSVTGDPATLSESTMAYSKRYWEQQKWEDGSKYAECLPFIKNRHDTVCTGPSVFIVTQFTHGENTVTRRVERNAISEYNYVRFEQSLTVYDSKIFNQIRASVIRKNPIYREAIDFINETQSYDLSKFKKYYSYLSDNTKANPLIINTIREKFYSKVNTSGKDVVYYCGPGSHLKFSNPWNPMSKQLGGSEEAVINLSNELSKCGYNVTVYCVLEGTSKKYGNVMYRPYYEWIPKDLQDITIIWRDPSNCDKSINSQFKFLDLHDVLDYRWLKELDPMIRIMTKSKYHQEVLKLNELDVIPDRNIVVPNGIFTIDPCVEKVKNLMVSTSSPDRCLRALLRALPLIRKEVPDAEIHWAYGFKSGISKGGMESNARTKNWVEETKEIMRNTAGFKDLGRLSQVEITELYKKADVFIYPTRFPEIDCISLTKAMAAGCIPVCTPSGAIAEKLGINDQCAKLKNEILDYSLEEGPEFDNFVKATIAILKNPRPNRADISKYANEKYNWSIIAQQWIKKCRGGGLEQLITPS